MKKSNGFNIEKRKAITGLLFTLPWIIGILIFYVYPMLSSVYYSFTSYSVLSPGNFVGFNNYKALFEDKIFWQSISNTLVFTALSVPINIILGVVIAMLLNTKIRATGIYRTIFFIPTLVPVIAVSTIWKWLLDSNNGLINSILNVFGIENIPWLTSERWSKPALVLIATWGIGQAIIINISGLQSISRDLYEAADIDGANGLQKTIKITMPLLTPIIFYNLIMGIINSLQIFTLPHTLTNGEGTPVNSLMFYVMYLYNNAFGYMKMGYASAMAWILFVVILVLTIIVFKTSEKWVYYE